MNKYFQHTIAVIITTLVLTVIPLGICGTMLIVGADMGSPLVIILIPIVCYATAIEISCLLLAPLAELLQRISNRWHWPLWLSPFVVFFLCGFILLPIIFFTGHFPEWALVTSLGIVYLTVGFIAYWLALLLRALDRISL